jgi:hypothetical protein
MCFQKRLAENVFIFFSVTRQPKNLKTICANTERTVFILQVNSSSRGPVLPPPPPKKNYCGQPLSRGESIGTVGKKDQGTG